MKRLLVLALAVTGILAAGCIVRFGTLYTQDNTSHFVALASNLTNVDVVAASVQVDFYDSGNRLLKTEFTGPCTRTLQKGKDAPIEVVLPTGITANHVQTTVRPITFGTKAVADLNIDNIQITTADTTTHITGDIDVGNKDLYAINVCAALLDRHGNVLKVGRHAASPTNIDSDDSGTFDVSMTADDDATQFEIWVDAVTHTPSDITAPVVVGPEDISATIMNTGALSPTESVAGGDWTDPDNAFDEDETFATVETTDGNPMSEVYTGYPLDDADIPNDAAITGIAVSPEWFVNETGADAKITVELSWDGGTHWTDAKTDSNESTDEENAVTLGSSTDDWGHDWDVDELTDTDFQVRITADTEAGVARTFSLDWIPVTVYFTED
jgi:hypothetical protein